MTRDETIIQILVDNGNKPMRGSKIQSILASQGYKPRSRIRDEFRTLKCKKIIYRRAATHPRRRKGDAWYSLDAEFIYRRQQAIDMEEIVRRSRSKLRPIQYNLTAPLDRTIPETAITGLGTT